MKFLTQQEVFTKVATHLLTQNNKSIAKFDCAYRGSNGAMCAIGCLIDDVHYYPKLEGEGIGSPEFDEVLKKCGVAEESFSLLSDLQYIHDEFEAIEWRDELSNVSMIFGLEMPVFE